MEEVFTKEHFVEVLEALHRDQTGLSAALIEVKKLVAGWSWAAESRGSYAWDDDEYQKEFGYCLDTITELVDHALTRTSQAHQVCCGKYGHIHFLDNAPVQMQFPFEDADYNKLRSKLIKFSTIEGRK